MKKLRSTVVAAGAAVAMLVHAAPASAASAAIFEGTASIGCFGCGGYGPTGNSVSFRITGTVNGVTVVNAAGRVTLMTVNGPVGVTCVLSGSYTGQVAVDGVGETHFNATQTGAFVVATTDWGTAVAAFKVTSPVGNPCGGPVEASFAGVLVGF